MSTDVKWCDVAPHSSRRCTVDALSTGVLQSGQAQHTQIVQISKLIILGLVFKRDPYSLSNLNEYIYNSVSHTIYCFIIGHWNII